MVMLRSVGDDEHVGIGSATLDLLSSRAAFGAATPVIPPKEKRMEGKYFH